MHGGKCKLPNTPESEDMILLNTYKAILDCVLPMPPLQLPVQYVPPSLWFSKSLKAGLLSAQRGRITEIYLQVFLTTLQTYSHPLQHEFYTLPSKFFTSFTYLVLHYPKFYPVHKENKLEKTDKVNTEIMMVLKYPL